MRLFIAIDIDEETRRQLASARLAIERVWADTAQPPRVTWVRDTAAHVTLRFIGDTPPHGVAAIQESLSAIAVVPFSVTWRRLGLFGGTRRPRVIVVEPDEGVDPLVTLARRINQELHPLLGRGDSRPFKPHLTLARIRDAGRGVRWREALDQVAWRPTVTRVSCVVLYQSRLSPKGPTYTAVSTHG